ILTNSFAVRWVVVTRTLRSRSYPSVGMAVRSRTPRRPRPAWGGRASWRFRHALVATFSVPPIPGGGAGAPAPPRDRRPGGPGGWRARPGPGDPGQELRAGGRLIHPGGVGPARDGLDVYADHQAGRGHL